jgi:hypothetical protein
MAVRYAVLMKIHYWDDFIERRLRHLLREVTAGDVHIFVDETHGAVGEIPHDRVTRVTERDMERLGVLLHPPGQVLWYNADYPLYYFYLENSSYDYYLMCEYDAVFNVDVDQFVQTAASKRVDYVGFPLAKSFTEWDWRKTCDGVYPESQTVYNWLNCISLHSRQSIEFLLERRKILARRYNAGEIVNWPYTEGFIATEMKNNGFVARELGEFGRADKYNWWPPIHEEDLPSLQDQAFLHPVLDERKYVASCVRYGRLRSYFFRDSQLRRLLERSPLRYTLPSLMNEFIRRLGKRLSALSRPDAIGRVQRS